MHDNAADVIADCVLTAFDALPASRKPRGESSGLGAGRREWVPLAGIVIEGRLFPFQSLYIFTFLLFQWVDAQQARIFKCVALATGMKCLPQEKIPLAAGNVLHDCHAEVLALRALNRYILDGCLELATKGRPPIAAVEDYGLVQWTKQSDGDTTASKHQQYCFRLKEGVKLHMYCSEAPCGDASMELTMAAQDDATPWNVPRSLNGPEDTDEVQDATECAADTLHGRGYFGELGVVRRKPSRPDAPITLSKSCSDKLALKQCTSALSSITSMFVDPNSAYLDSIILPESQLVTKACERAFGVSGRMNCVLDAQIHWGQSYRFHPFTVKSTAREFVFSRRPSRQVVVTPSNLATVVYGNKQETLINGVLQGRKQTDPKGASSLARRQMMSMTRNIEACLDVQGVCHVISEARYADVKQCPSLSDRQIVKASAKRGALRGWKANEGDEDWCIDERTSTI